jgi:hypothetical protein
MANVFQTVLNQLDELNKIPDPPPVICHDPVERLVRKLAARRAAARRRGRVVKKPRPL